MSCSHGHWCTRADALLGVEGIHVTAVKTTASGLVLRVETGDDLAGCPDCGVVAVDHGRRQVRLHDVPCFGRPVRLLWAKRVWRCADPDCPRTTFTEAHSLAGPRTKPPSRAASWATHALQGFDTSVSALAHQLGVSWHTARDAIQTEAAQRITRAGRLTGVNALGVDEHVWSHTGPPGTGIVTGIVDHTRDENGVVHARLSDLVPGRSGKAYADWLKDRGTEFTAGIKTAALDPFRGYANAIRDELPEAITVLDAFHVVVIASFPTGPILEVARLGRTLKQWKAAILSVSIAVLLFGRTALLVRRVAGPRAQKRPAVTMCVVAGPIVPERLTESRQGLSTSAG